MKVKKILRVLVPVAALLGIFLAADCQGGLQCGVGAPHHADVPTSPA